jgi:hypothetical protein
MDLVDRLTNHTTLGAAPLEDRATGLRRHARAEAVLALAAANVGLVGALHRAKNPMSSRLRAGQYSHPPSTAFSTSSGQGTKPLRGVSPTTFHSCGGIMQVW